MRLPFRLLFAAFLLSLLAISHSLVVVDSTLASACIYYLKTYDWGCGSHGNGMSAYKCRCANVNWLGSVANCIYSESNSTAAIDHALTHVATRCKQKAGYDYSLDDMKSFYLNATLFLRDPIEAIDTFNLVTDPVNVNQSEFDFYDQSFKDFSFSVQRSQWFGWGLVFYWAAVLAVSSLFNLNKRYLNIKFLNSNYLKKFLILPLIVNKNNSNSFLFTKVLRNAKIPSIVNFCILFVFAIQVIISCCVGYDLQLPNAFINDRWHMNMTLISYRTDLMSISLFPLIFFFGIRNNPFIPLTGLSFSTFNLYHKFIAYIMVILAFIHAIIWTVYSVRNGGYQAWFSDTYFQYGVAAMIISSILLFQSLRYFKDHIYEIFLLLHKILNVFFIVVMYFHINTLGWLGWIWSMVAIWCFDRFVRIVKICLSGGIQTVDLYRFDDNVIKMSIKKPKFFKYYQGSYSYIYFLSNSYWFYSFQSHPFSLVSSPIEDKGNLIIYFKAKNGITKSILKLLNDLKANEPLKLKIIIEGPYGNSTGIRKKAIENKKFVGIVGGLGVTAVYPSFVEVLKNRDSNSLEDKFNEKSLHSNNNNNNNNNSTDTSTVSSSKNDDINTYNHDDYYDNSYTDKFYWIINDLNNLNWFHKDLDWLVSKNCFVNVIYTGSKDIKFEELVNIPTNEIHYKITRKYSRPDLNEIVEKNIFESVEDNKEISILACGPEPFNNSVRYSIKNNITPEVSVKVNYHEENFGW
ncbi:ferric/cupric-chelate reductase ASCRUDRAFT_74746 [Ascoidea rubescens DSM 1968]|uniref:ferric-chelate reductase (NADPH) n=1 Tax=Ascoidea rubescens DSM 1968 TaxID=1344418 RepID=A0A1D2VL55_9ASCO|nr:hypothetical protein ASCRUDRAFT_74746 [Ascoidea rubescens DSM 1968]ODV62346.1 hypothetical protein ASCRUDRAFT_74746 [Ascoidea rubescens DSM 1968]